MKQITQLIAFMNDSFWEKIERYAQEKDINVSEEITAISENFVLLINKLKG